MNKKNHTIQDIIISVIIFISVWHIISLIIKSYFLPTPANVIKTLIFLLIKGKIIPHIIASLKRTIIGFLAAVITGSLIAYALGLSGKAYKYFQPIIEFIRPIPPLAWTPLAIVWFGIGNGSAIFIIFLATFFPIFTNVYVSVRNLPTNYKRLKHHYRLNTIQYFTHVVFPYSAPYLLSGSKIGLGLSWMAVIASEMIASNKGLGYYIELNRVLLNTSAVISTMIIIAVLGYLMNMLISQVNKKTTRWI